MKKKKKRIKRKNGVAKALQHPSFKLQVIPDKRQKALDRLLNEEY